MFGFGGAKRTGEAAGIGNSDDNSLVIAMPSNHGKLKQALLPLPNTEAIAMSLRGKGDQLKSKVEPKITSTPSESLILWQGHQLEEVFFPGNLIDAFWYFDTTKHHARGMR